MAFSQMKTACHVTRLSRNWNQFRTRIRRFRHGSTEQVLTMNLTLFLFLAVAGLSQAARRVPRQVGMGYHQYQPAYPRLESPIPFVQALCQMESTFGNDVNGEIHLTQYLNDPDTLLVGQLQGLTPGFHGFHVHEHGDTGKNCSASGSHFNPDKVDHGGPTSAIRHAGDLGNIVADDLGRSSVYIKDSHISLLENHPRSVVNRALVIHAKVDDFGQTDHPDSKKTGNAGARVACCVIRPIN